MVRTRDYAPLFSLLASMPVFDECSERDEHDEHHKEIRFFYGALRYFTELNAGRKLLRSIHLQRHLRLLHPIPRRRTHCHRIRPRCCSGACG